ncbi:50S ribosomal protein L13 [Candidatus Pacearchaeota archaeon CG10_big_fil_rev_8_21_14_0_10_31_24]|nr:MAG: 50S ribosomal protein L13 [Candidatus Pacearchaeota archaeon CG10_big_fil_rev_8_21_14_0_10_31_24]
MNKIIIDGTDAVLGRLASYAAKQSLLGKEVIIVNCDSISIMGNRKNVIGEWHHAARRGGASLKGPAIPRKNTEKIVKRTIRGMLSHQQKRGEDALDRIMCYPQIPEEFQAEEKISMARTSRSKSIKLKELSKHL